MLLDNPYCLTEPRLYTRDLAATVVGQRRNWLMVVSMVEQKTRADKLLELKEAAVAHRPEEINVPPNLIPPGCQAITPDMLPLLELRPEHIREIAEVVPGGMQNIQDIYPLAPLQEGLLFHHRLREQDDSYVVSTLFDFESRALLEAFIRGLQWTVGRHDILRTAVLWERLPLPVQVVQRRVIVPVEELELPAHCDALTLLQNRMGADCPKLDLRKAPLMQLYVAAARGSSHWLALLRLHHLVCDARSLDAVYADLNDHLQARMEGAPEPLQYRDHVARTLALARIPASKAFFRAKLAQIDEPTAPYGLLEVDVDSSSIDELREQLDPALGRRLRVQARRQRASPATLFHAAWGLVVARTSGRSTVVYGTVLLGSSQSSGAGHRKVGMFLNTLPLRLQLQDVAVGDLVRQTQYELLELLQHEQSPLAVARSCSGIAGSAPLFTALLNYRGAAGEPPWSRAASGIRILASRAWTNYPITLSVDDFGEEFALTIQTDHRIGSQQMMRNAHAALKSLVEALEATPQMPALALSILPDRDWQQIIRTFNATRAFYPHDALVHELFEAQVKRTPDAIALTHRGQRVTYDALNRKANQLAYFLKELGVGPDALVALCAERSAEMLVGLLGILKAGGAYVPLDPAYPAERLAYMLTDAAPVVLLTQERLRIALPPTGARVVTLDRDWAEISRRTDANPVPGSMGLTSQNLAYIIYTSGSTGHPKGVMVEHASVVNFLCSMQESPGIDATDCVLALTTVSFDIAALEIYLPLVRGARLVLATREAAHDARQLIEMMDEAHVTFLQATPATWRLLLSAGWQGNSGLKALSGGEALTTELCGQLVTKVRELWNMYGPTETTIWSCTRHITAMQTNGQLVESIGRPIANTRVYILDSHLQPTPIGVPGEIHIGGVGVARGYLNRPELTSQRFIADHFGLEPHSRLYKTGDIGKWRADGTIEFLGRNDHQVKIRGFRIELGEIEALLTHHQHVKEAIVVAREDIPGEKRLVAYVVVGDRSVASDHTAAQEIVRDGDANMPAGLGPGQQLLAHLREYLKERLPDYMIPAAWVVLRELPLTPNGKVDRRALPAPQGRPEEIDEYIPPSTVLERTLADIWSQVLGVDQVGVHDNFFELGGHSLLGMRLIAKMAEALAMQPPIITIFQYPTIAQMARFLGTLLPSAVLPQTLSELELEDGFL